MWDKHPLLVLLFVMQKPNKYDNQFHSFQSKVLVCLKSVEDEDTGNDKNTLNNSYQLCVMKNNTNLIRHIDNKKSIICRMSLFCKYVKHL